MSFFSSTHFVPAHPSKLPTVRTMRQWRQDYTPPNTKQWILIFRKSMDVEFGSAINQFEVSLFNNRTEDDQRKMSLYYAIIKCNDEEKPIEDIYFVMDIWCEGTQNPGIFCAPLRWGEIKLGDMRSQDGCRFWWERATLPSELKVVEISLDLHVAYDEKKTFRFYKDVKIHEAMANLFLNEDKSDFKIICEGKTYPCHKLIICSQSDVFNAMLDNNLMETKEGQVEIKDILSDTMDVLLKFMYQGKVDSQNVDVDLLIAADRYNVKKLVAICVNHFKYNLSVNNAMEVLTASYLVDGNYAKDLFEAASKFARNHKGDLVKTEKYEELKKSYPDIILKVMDVITFKA